MRRAPFIADTEFVHPKPALVLGQTLKRIFTAMIAALHHSRRLQAERFLRQNRHLIDVQD
jgi:hypothetical protein